MDPTIPIVTTALCVGTLTLGVLLMWNVLRFVLTHMNVQSPLDDDEEDDDDEEEDDGPYVGDRWKRRGRPV
jgi:hypothetical protein